MDGSRLQRRRLGQCCGAARRGRAGPLLHRNAHRSLDLEHRGGDQQRAVGMVYVRKKFTVADPSSISSAVLRVNADDSHMTYVNGKLASSSPAR